MAHVQTGEVVVFLNKSALTSVLKISCRLWDLLESSGQMSCQRYPFIGVVGAVVEQTTGLGN